MENNDYII